MEDFARVIVGLGNPGKRYARNRHNAGFMAIEALAREAHAGTWSTESRTRVCRAEIGGCPVVLAEPWSCMNDSGQAVQLLLSALHRTPEDLLLVLDDLNLPFGRIRIRQRGSAGGHRGLESILSSLKTEEILRLRLGIGEGEMPREKANFVLADIPPERQRELDEMISRAGDAVRAILRDGTAKAMAYFNA